MKYIKTTSEMLDDLRGAMLAKIGHAPEIVQITDKLERFDTAKKGDKCGWYVCYEFSYTAKDDTGKTSRHFALSAAFGNWKEGYTHKFNSFSESALDRKAIAELKRIRKAQADTQRAERERLARRAQEKAWSMLEESEPATHAFPYLMRKKAQAHGSLQYGDVLINALRDLDGVTHNVQTIAADGTKRFLFGGRKKGLFCVISDLPDVFALMNPEGVYLCEGWATGASLYEAYGLPVLVAFDAGNLLSVAQAYRARYPNIPITLCADNDRKTPINTGVTKAHEVAAKVVGVDVMIPEFPAHAPIELSDFNDAVNYYNSSMEVAA